MTPTDNLEAGAGDLVAVAWLFECTAGPYKGEIDVHSRDGQGGDEEARVADFYSEPFPVVRLSEAAAQLAAVTAENARLREALERKQDLFDALVSFVHRWTWVKEGNGTSDAERLDVIKHYPPIAARAALSQEAPK